MSTCGNLREVLIFAALLHANGGSIRIGHLEKCKSLPRKTAVATSFSAATILFYKNCVESSDTLSFKWEVSGRAFEELNKICYGIFSAVIIDDDMVKLDVFRRQVGAIQPR